MHSGEKYGRRKFTQFPARCARGCVAELDGCSESLTFSWTSVGSRVSNATPGGGSEGGRKAEKVFPTRTDERREGSRVP